MLTQRALCSMGLVLGLLSPASLYAQEKPVKTTSADRRTPWLERPWEMRYFLHITDNWKSEKEAAIETNKERAARAGASSLDRLWPEIVERSQFFPFTDKWSRPSDGISVVLIEFDRDGKVKTPHAFGAPLQGRWDQLMYVVLAAGQHATQQRFAIGEWFMGLGDTSTHWAPGLCSSLQMPSPFSKVDTGYLYGPKFDWYNFRSTFGCREWAYQLYDPDRPYIDVTSYFPKSKDPDGAGSYIREAVGWARFGDKKPVIGKHEAQWYCLHDCPGDEKPGPIADINAWAKQNGWPAPKRPTRIPVFPDPPAKQGIYPK